MKLKFEAKASRLVVIRKCMGTNKRHFAAKPRIVKDTWKVDGGRIVRVSSVEGTYEEPDIRPERYVFPGGRKETEGVK